MSSVSLNKKDNGKQKQEQKRLSVNEIIRGRGIRRFYTRLLFISVVVVTVLVFYLQWQNRVFSESILVSSSATRFVSGITLMNLDGFILGYSKDGISLTDSSGRAVWNQTYEMQEPRVVICRNVVAVADYLGSTVYVLDTEQKLGEINTNLPIRNLDVAASGHVLTVLEDGNTTWINQYAADGTQISNSRTTMNESGYPMSITLSPNGRLVGISFFSIMDGVSRSSLAFYNFGPVGQNVQNYMSGYNYANTIVPIMRFINDSSAFAVSDDRIMFFSGNEQPLSSAEHFLAENVRSIYSGEDHVGLVFHATSGEAMYRVDIYDSRGRMILEKEFDFDYREVILARDVFIIYNELDLLICSYDGTERYRGSLHRVTSLLIPTGQNNRYIAVTNEAIDVLEFR
ncbi:MAG: DUF5711 family protein [Lachnospiraceae bacterium]|jgi:hypothetical protein|nr:DUF5711 family protein [Lachnospiraceae bacterium]